MSVNVKELEKTIRLDTLKNQYLSLEKRVKRIEEVVNSDEFIEYRNLTVKANQFIKGNKIKGMADYDFPQLKGISGKQEYSARKYREAFVIANSERFETLAKTLEYSDRFNWKLLHEMKVTPQEYVILFSFSAGDIYARGIPNCFDDDYEYIPGSCDEYEYDD